MSSVQLIYEGNDHILELVGLQGVATGDYENAATVTVTLKDSSGVEVSGQAWPTTMTYVTGSNGRYRATLEDVLVLTSGSSYTAIIEADAGSGLKGKWELDLKCQTRR